MQVSIKKILNQKEGFYIYKWSEVNKPDCIVQLISDIRWIGKPFLRDQ